MPMEALATGVRRRDVLSGGGAEVAEGAESAMHFPFSIRPRPCHGQREPDFVELAASGAPGSSIHRKATETRSATDQGP
eukprot:scaffold20506_cov38-Prasinocladus_malaysianus.AAC.1